MQGWKATGFIKSFYRNGTAAMFGSFSESMSQKARDSQGFTRRTVEEAFLSEIV